MDNLEIYERYREVPKEAQKDIQGGRMKGKTDINPMWRIKALTEQFGACGMGWYYKPVKKWLEQHGDEIAAFVDIELFIKVDGEWSMPISGTGGSMFSTVERSGIFVSDECYKMATTDAISVACKQLGFGADIYWGADRSKYDISNDKQSTTTKAETKTASNTITKTEAEALKKLVEKKGLDINKVFNVPVENLTKEQYVSALKQLEKLGMK